MTPKQSQFAQLHAAGTAAPEAYAQVYGCTAKSASVNASKLLAKDHIIAEVDRLRKLAKEQADADAVLSINEKRILLARIVRTPVSKLNQHDDTRDLIKKVTCKLLGTGEAAEEIEEIEGYDKLRVIQLDTELAGDGASIGNSSDFTQFLKSLPTTGMIRPNDKM